MTIFHKDANYEAFERVLNEGLEKYPVSLFVCQMDAQSLGFASVLRTSFEGAMREAIFLFSYFIPIFLAICVHFLDRDNRGFILLAWAYILPLACIMLTAGRQVLVALQCILITIVMAFSYNIAHGILVGFLLLSATLSFPIIVFVSLIVYWWHVRKG